MQHTDEQLRWMLQGFVKGIGKQGEAAKQLDISRVHLNNVMAGRDPAGKAVREFFGIVHPFTQRGYPCPFGHRERYISNGRCAVCGRQYSRDYQAERRLQA